MLNTVPATDTPMRFIRGVHHLEIRRGSASTNPLFFGYRDGFLVSLGRDPARILGDMIRQRRDSGQSGDVGRMGSGISDFPAKSVKMTPSLTVPA